MSSALDLVFREVTAETWPDLEALFEARRGPKSCWCMVGKRDVVRLPATA